MSKVTGSISGGAELYTAVVKGTGFEPVGFESQLYHFPSE